MKKSALFLLFSCLLFISPSLAKESVDTGFIKKVLPPVEKFFVGNALDGAIFSTATIQNPTTSPSGSVTTTNTLGTIRFSLVINVGVTFNFNLNRHLGIYTGVDLKNIGFIEKDAGGETVKRRTYNLGAPLGIKIGNMAYKCGYLFLGGGMDVPVNYKEKTFVTRSGKTKLNEWFSSRTPSLMPYIFAGYAFGRGATFKIQYYPGNFLNTGYTSGSARPYAGMDVHLILVCLGFNLRYGKAHQALPDKHAADLKTM
jgi:hypothetical protein